jgi:tetratricopeptide (TPR) repeat protein
MNERLRQLITIGREHYHAGEYEQAERYLAEVVKEHQGFADIFNMLGVIYHTQGRLAEAETAFENALYINPSYTDAALNLSVTYNDRGKYEKARDVYSAAIHRSYQQPRSLDPFARGKIANMHADLGAVYAGVALYDEAVREYSKALEMGPDFVDIRTRLGNVYREMGLYNAAIAEFERVKSEKPGYLPARIYLGVTLFSVGRRDDAVAEWESVLAIEPEHKSAHLYLRMVRDDKPPAAGSALTGPRGE